MASVGNMQDAALKRKERLRALQEKKQNPESEKTNENAENADSTETESLPRPVFRSYKPQDDTLKESSITQAKPADVSEKIKSQLEETQIKEVISEVDLINLAPRKPDWDLKRDVAKKLEKLERRTQRAIAELIRERLKESNEDFALVVNASEAERGKV